MLRGASTSSLSSNRERGSDEEFKLTRGDIDETTVLDDKEVEHFTNQSPVT
jgi:hypothetical protein